MAPVYALNRDAQESGRLNTQHAFIRALNNGDLLHRRVPQSQVSTIADVGTGTGIWLRDCAESLQLESRKGVFVGFDVSPLQFPKDEVDGMRFVAHDMTERFPSEYHGTFDLVNVRLVAAAVPVEDLTRSIGYILEILRPGGYLQWLDADASDIFAKPFSPIAQSFLRRISEEKAAGGLSLCFSQDILKNILSLKTPVPHDAAYIDVSGRRVNLVTRSECAYRLLTYDPVLNYEHPSAEVRAAGPRALSAAYRAMLRKSAVDRRTAAGQEHVSEAERRDLVKAAEENESLVTAVEREEEAAAFQWQWSLTWIVAQKAVFVGKDEDWLNAGHAYPDTNA